MNCSDLQDQMTTSTVKMPGTLMLNEVLSPGFKPQAPAGSAPSQMGPYATAGGISGISYQPSPFATTGVTTQQAGGVTQQTGPFATAGQLLPITPTTQPMPMTLDSLQYLNGALRTQIGNKVTVDFLIGTNTFQDRSGILLAVGANYIIINETDTDDILFCDYYSIKFVKVYK